MNSTAKLSVIAVVSATAVSSCLLGYALRGERAPGLKPGSHGVEAAGTESPVSVTGDDGQAISAAVAWFEARFGSTDVRRSIGLHTITLYRTSEGIVAKIAPMVKDEGYRGANHTFGVHRRLVIDPHTFAVIQATQPQ